MPIITKSDLIYKDYSWSTFRGDDPRLTGEPDATLLNRHEGYEVLHFISRFCDRHTWNPPPATKASAQKAERLIRQHVPSNVRSRQGIDQWLIQNWGQYA
ncbi:hypothetical protein [Caldimonas sp. KR1-144]|uniref:hypothetical protein n=1 Tax=Caldimonas sp. KR1-144 TaxID=3400911 RepID=UPI003C07FE14